MIAKCYPVLIQEDASRRLRCEPYGMEVSTKAVGTPEEAITIWNGDRHKLTPT
ncbi:MULTISPECIES: hypothetical protein [Bradyrhizobium]|uniref:Uncharacterized protein n=3 Tax=Bradyrhizobium TaxID=374 RepID=A0A810B549_9BRAD|nr:MULTISPECIES: hypothetical protein [Bradyrhizobium]MBP1059672.1 hypothetical protein [Bradyrhizobium japonicum]MBR1292110.1 hypothetical protein [Bradyrhizobium ottawaense]MCS3499629.1 hypothetical protein [Bradyrhizobium japonicum]MCS3933430.1 hypothetical protein [Bradyrhizobium elkanii]MCS3958209.1 hypothetical protein [Bradyrhizobium japonicum]